MIGKKIITTTKLDREVSKRLVDMKIKEIKRLCGIQKEENE